MAGRTLAGSGVLTLGARHPFRDLLGQADLPAGTERTRPLLVIHLLEHLDASHGALLLAEALRCATGRVVVAVPFEEEGNESYGHVRTLSLDDLAGLGDGAAEAYGFGWSVHEHHGGWLVLER